MFFCFRSVYEDGALAQKLQSEEITGHLSDNRRKNVQIRDDFPRALEEQTKEEDQVNPIKLFGPKFHQN